MCRVLVSAVKCRQSLQKSILNLEDHWRAKTHASGTNSQILKNDDAIRSANMQIGSGSMQIHLELNLFDRRLTIVPGRTMDGGRADSTQYRLFD